MEENIPLSNLTTFKIGGPARFFFHAKSLEDIKKALLFAEEKVVPFFVLGGGSNILASDEGFKGVIIKNELRGIEFKDLGDEVEVTAAAGEPWDDFVERVVKKGLYGLENLSGIPGTVGATPVQNIGAYGVEVGNLISSVEVWDSQTGSLKAFSKDDCCFAYRDSFFKTALGKNYVVIRVSFLLKKNGTLNIGYKDLKNHFEKTGKKSELLSVREAVLQIRRGKFPDLTTTGTAGSFFKNPIISEALWNELKEKFPDLPSFKVSDGKVKIPLAWILDNVLYYRGLMTGRVGLYEAQPLVLINSGGGKAADVLQLAEDVTLKVKDKTGISLHWEVEYLK